MKRSAYRERDYAFGQIMLTLRSAIGLTQAGLAAILGVSRQTILTWEFGGKYPKVEHLRSFIALAVQYHAFSAAREAEEIRGLWRSAHQKVLLDEAWLAALLAAPSNPGVQISLPNGRPRVDWGDAIDVPTFYGREQDLALLTRWVVDERCQLVSILGMGGIGKSALAVTLMRRVSARFDVVIWRSLRDAPTCDALVEDCLQVLAPPAPRNVADSLEARLHLLMEALRKWHVLLVLDNLEMLLEEGTHTGHMRTGAEGYARLLRQIGETSHQSCLLFTSREKPADLVPLEGSHSPVRAIRLTGLDSGAGAQLLA
jgi:transcriptional regulator with XRE-family HTH domain